MDSPGFDKPDMSESSNQHRVIDVQRSWAMKPELMGSKDKFWYRDPRPPGKMWLFKYPRENTGEHWAEKLSSEVASQLSIPHARVELGIFENQLGSVCQSFTQDAMLLVHGNELLSKVFSSYGSGPKRHQSKHTLDNIWAAVDNCFVKKEGANEAKGLLAEYMVLDALIGNTDRHHENWGILRMRIDDKWWGNLAPSFDHASSLGRELMDEKRKTILANNHIGRYAERGRGGIFLSEDDRRAPSPIELVRRARVSNPEFFLPALARLEEFDEIAPFNLVNRVPNDWMSATAKEFAAALMCYNLKCLKEMSQ